MIAYEQDIKKHQFLIISFCIHAIIGMLSVIIVHQNVVDHNSLQDQLPELPAMAPPFPYDDDQITIVTEPDSNIAFPLISRKNNYLNKKMIHKIRYRQKLKQYLILLLQFQKHYQTTSQKKKIL